MLHLKFPAANVPGAPWQAGPDVPQQLIYREDRCGARWPVAVGAVLGWAVLAGCGIAANAPHLAGLGVAAAAGAVLAVIMTAALVFGSSLGIRVDSTGIQLGGVNARDRRMAQGKWPPRKPPKALQQNKAVFTCPWEGVRSLYLITDKPERQHIRRDLRKFLKSSGSTTQPLGVFYQAWFVKAELIITNNPELASSDPDEFRAVRGRYGRMQAAPSPTWKIPTRHPEALRAALEQVPDAPRIQDHLPPEAVFQFRA